MIVVIKKNDRAVPSFPINTPIPVVYNAGKEFIIDAFGGYLDVSKIADCEIDFEVRYK